MTYANSVSSRWREAFPLLLFYHVPASGLACLEFRIEAMQGAMVRDYGSGFRIFADSNLISWTFTTLQLHLDARMNFFIEEEFMDRIGGSVFYV